ncbi:raffinose synthase protein-like protein Sip1 [Aureobasidium pullulans]|uniref:Raffinose synthase protein-like protein Sip1 n=1 Tax=Aureobasidium pullulans TaxID=5580 RepID=A0AB74ITH1_AURPU|nr:raffinose synthase protein-like protein Sip1 [Aureobasidium pullulans]
MKKKQNQITFGFCDVNTGQRVYPALTDLPDKLPPAQQLYTSDDNMYAAITCSPPIGQSTAIPKNQTSVPFSVLLETTASSLVKEDDIKVSIWHNHKSQHDWSELALTASSDHDDVLLVNSKSQIARRWYTGDLPGRPDDLRPVSFTVKFQMGSDSGWKWIKDQSGLDDGHLHYQQSHEGLGFPGYFRGTSSDLNIRKTSADTPDTKLYSITTSVEPAKGNDSGYSRYILGTPKDFTRWFSLVRLWSPWLAPRQGRDKFHLDKDAVLAAFLRHDGAHVVCLAISGVEDVLTVFQHDDDGNMVIQARNDRETEGTSHVVVAVANTFEIANAAVMYHARKIVGGYESATGQVEVETKALMEKNVKAEWLEEWYDGFTYCTWNGLGQKLTVDKIIEALESLKNAGIIIENLIIDDNWQSLTEGKTQMERGWTDFDANKEGFPQGLKHAVTDIRKKHPNINHIAVWHAILGYWGGVAEGGNIAKNYKTTTVQKEPGVAEGEMLVVDGSDAQRMYNDFYAFLDDCGITGVKTDAQFFLDMIVDAPDRRSLITEYQDAWTIAHLRHFGSRAISCMSQSPQLLFHSQLPTNKPRLLVRNSDDFFPEVPASHPWHVFCNAHNSLLTQHLNVIPDWDMFQTSHEWASFHGAARCVSGGPIYFTDYPGKHDIRLINQMTARTTRGKTVILRPHNVGKSTNAYAGYEDHSLLKVHTYHGYARTGTAYVGVFNCTQRPLSELIPLSTFAGAEEGKYIIRAFTTSAISKPMSLGEKKSLVGVEIDVGGWEILSAHPVHEHTLHRGGAIAVASLGLLGKMTGAAAIESSDVYVDGQGRLRYSVLLKALGVLGFWIGDLAKKWSVDKDMLVLIFGKQIPEGCVSVDGDVLKIDVDKAWKETGQKAGWSNEIEVELFIS